MIWVSWPKKSSGVATDLTDVVVRDGTSAWARRYQGLCDRRRLVRAEIRDPEGSTEQQTPEMMFGRFVSASS